MKGRRTDRRWEAHYDAANQVYVVSGKGIERLVAMTQLTNEAAVNRLQRTLEKAGIINKLRALGAKEGDTVRIGKAEFDFFDEDALDEPDEDEEEEPLAPSRGQEKSGRALLGSPEWAVGADRYEPHRHQSRHQHPDARRRAAGHGLHRRSRRPGRRPAGAGALASSWSPPGRSGRAWTG